MTDKKEIPSIWIVTGTIVFMLVLNWSHSRDDECHATTRDLVRAATWPSEELIDSLASRVFSDVEKARVAMASGDTADASIALDSLESYFRRQVRQFDLDGSETDELQNLEFSLYSSIGDECAPPYQFDPY